MVKFEKKNVLASFGITLLAAVCAVLVGLKPDFSELLLAATLTTLALSVVFCKKYNKAGLTVNRILVGMLFIFSSFTKGVDPLGTKYKILDYLSAYGMQWLNDFSLVLSVLLILVEFLVGICLLLNILPRLAALGATVLMLFFTATTFFDAKYDLVADCGCFGTAIKMSNWQTFFKNLIIDALVVPLIVNNKVLVNKRVTKLGQWIFATLLVACFVGFEIYNIRHLPIIDFVEWKVGKDMTPKEYDAGKIFVTYQNMETAEIQEFESPNYPWNDSVWMSKWQFVSQRSEGGSQTLGFSMLDADGEDFTHILFETENLYVFVAPYIDEFSDEDFDLCKKMIEIIENKGDNYIWLTSMLPEYMDELNDDYKMFYDVYFGDELELKTMVRSNPGLMLIDNGLIINKWSRLDFPIEE